MRNTVRTFPIRRVALVAAAVSAALVLAACGSEDGDSGREGHGSTPSSSASSTAAGSHNAQDVVFAQGMIPHHRQALEMAELAAGRASSTQVRDLASRIEKAQDPEIRTMSGWLKAWGEDVPSATSSAMPGMDDSAHSGMPGMMADKDMTELEKASGTGFDTMFLTMMTEHHQGAVEMADTEKDKGGYGPAKDMAGDIVTGQTAEIAEMKKLLGKG
ncbi:DUF305 domain-containing protein [Streptomyces pseudovenezuelae]|uniref:Uncharacterized protein (DUF305 family) n=1 Tax=Streptomyces pseudovenezuelae TaxID=67350 RepID=A0ABT6LRB4_9ACTN|nr:DUF305 domain-containing protein [Streptomyces pseudovenezuelae]MDH6218788.1 uncharacterized protein (DUF305 family) [Streptomyces pseudovenezuelae]